MGVKRIVFVLYDTLIKAGNLDQIILFSHLLPILSPMIKGSFPNDIEDAQVIGNYFYDIYSQLIFNPATAGQILVETLYRETGVSPQVSILISHRVIHLPNERGIDKLNLLYLLFSITPTSDFSNEDIIQLFYKVVNNPFIEEKFMPFLFDQFKQRLYTELQTNGVDLLKEVINRNPFALDEEEKNILLFYSEKLKNP